MEWVCGFIPLDNFVDATRGITCLCESHDSARISQPALSWAQMKRCASVFVCLHGIAASRQNNGIVSCIEWCWVLGSRCLTHSPNICMYKSKRCEIVILNCILELLYSVYSCVFASARAGAGRTGGVIGCDLPLSNSAKWNSIKLDSSTFFYVSIFPFIYTSISLPFAQPPTPSWPPALAAHSTVLSALVCNKFSKYNKIKQTSDK